MLCPRRSPRWPGEKNCNFCDAWQPQAGLQLVTILFQIACHGSQTRSRLMQGAGDALCYWLLNTQLRGCGRRGKWQYAMRAAYDACVNQLCAGRVFEVWGIQVVSCAACWLVPPPPSAKARRVGPAALASWAWRPAKPAVRRRPAAAPALGEARPPARTGPGLVRLARSAPL